MATKKPILEYLRAHTLLCLSSSRIEPCPVCLFLMARDGPGRRNPRIYMPRFEAQWRPSKVYETCDRYGRIASKREA